jgi:hypothetical protein
MLIHVLIEFKKWMCYIDGQKNKYSVLNECSRMLKYNKFLIAFSIIYLNLGVCNSTDNGVILDNNIFYMKMVVQPKHVAA